MSSMPVAPKATDSQIGANAPAAEVPKGRDFAERIQEVLDGPHPPVGPRVRGARFKSALQDAKIASKPLRVLVDELNAWEPALRGMSESARAEALKPLESLVPQLLDARKDARTHPTFRWQLAAVCTTYAFAQFSPLERDLLERELPHLPKDSVSADAAEAKKGLFGRLWEKWRNTDPKVSVALQVGATVALATQGFTQADSLLEVGAALALARIGWEVADGLGYLYHAVVDQVDPDRCPAGMRDTAIEFQIHHHHPNIIREKDSMMVAERVACVLGPTTLGLALLGPGALASGFLTGLFTGALLSQECHKQAHFPDNEAPRWVRALRSAKMAIGTVEHGHHHTAPRDAYYSVLSGNVGRLMDMAGVNEWVHRRVQKAGWGFDEGETLRRQVDAREDALKQRTTQEA